MLIDSHCHLNLLDLTEYGGKVAQVLEHAKKLGVTHFLCASVDLENHAPLVILAEEFPQVFISAGVHPNEEGVGASVEQLLAQGQHPRVIAIGETGLDYYREHNVVIQRQQFENHIEAAKKLKKPLIIHTRSAQQDTLEILKINQAYQCQGVMHCFTETWEMAKAALDMGFYISFSGIITFKNAVDLQEVVKKMPLDRILVETDAPYLAPMPYRGKQNVPGYARYVAEAVATLRQSSLEEIAAATTQNFVELFQCEALM
jgi:TatD DNase family protein